MQTQNVDCENEQNKSHTYTTHMYKIEKYVFVYDRIETCKTKIRLKNLCYDSRIGNTAVTAKRLQFTHESSISSICKCTHVLHRCSLSKKMK